MAQRKRSAADEVFDEPDQLHKSKKRRRSGSGKKRKLSFDGEPPVSEVSCASKTIQYPRAPPGPEPPAGLDAAQRKRWRRRERRHRQRSVHANAQSEIVAQEHQSRATKPRKKSRRNAPKRPIDRAELLALAATSLMVPPKKEWQDVATQDHVSHARAGSALQRVSWSGASVTSEDELESKRFRIVVLRPTSDKVIKGHALGSRVDAGTKDDAWSNESSTSEDRWDPEQPSSRKTPLSTNNTQRTSPATVPTAVRLKATPNLSGFQTMRNAWTAPSTTAANNTLFGGKTISVPSYNDSGDVLEAYARFSAFVEGDGSSDSEEESESSDDEDNVPTHPAGKHSPKAKLEQSLLASRLPQTIIHHGRSREPEATVNVVKVPSSASFPFGGRRGLGVKLCVGTFEDEIEDSQETREPLSASDNDFKAAEVLRSKELHSATMLDPETDTRKPGSESSNDESTDESSSEAESSSVADPPRPYEESQHHANAGIMRKSSFLGVHNGGSRSVDGSIPTWTNSDLLAVSESQTAHAIQVLDDVANDLLTETRAIPDSKSTQELESKVPGRDDKLTTAAVRNFSIISDIKPPRLGLEKFVYEPPRMDLICNSAILGDAPNGLLRMDSETTLVEADRADAVVTTSQLAGPTRRSSSLTELSRTPSEPETTSFLTANEYLSDDNAVTEEQAGTVAVSASPLRNKKRKMTGRTSKHFSVPKRAKRQKLSDRTVVEALASGPSETIANEGDAIPTNHEAKPIRRRSDRRVVEAVVIPTNEVSNLGEYERIHHPRPVQLVISDYTPLKPNFKRKTTSKKSPYFIDTTNWDRVDLYNTTSSASKSRAPAGVSIAPVPSITWATFGIIQEKLWKEPFWLLIAVTFLNKTTGRAAVPVFWKLKEKYPTPEALAETDEEALVEMIHSLGLQRQRAKRLIIMAKAWMERQPECGKRWRTLHYPVKGDGREYKGGVVVEEDSVQVEGALEIGYMPGCGPYAWDSWRIFCRDVLRGVAEDYDGLNAKAEPEGGEAEEGEDKGVFEPEWMRVLPLDKELRACLRWMWLKRGWIWDCETGDKRVATEEEMERAVQGEMEMNDPLERRFAAQAKARQSAAVGLSAVQAETEQAAEDEVELEISTAKLLEDHDRAKKSASKTKSARLPKVAEEMYSENH